MWSSSSQLWSMSCEFTSALFFLPIENCLQSERGCALSHFVVVLCFGIENLRLELPHVLAARANYI